MTTSEMVSQIQSHDVSFAARPKLPAVVRRLGNHAHRSVGTARRADHPVLELSDSASLLGLITALQFLPVLVVGPWAGLHADRYEKRILIVITQLTMLATAVAVGVLESSDRASMPALVVASAVTGFAFAFQQPPAEGSSSSSSKSATRPTPSASSPPSTTSPRSSDPQPLHCSSTPLAWVGASSSTGRRASPRSSR